MIWHDWPISINQFCSAVVCSCLKSTSKSSLRYRGTQNTCFYADWQGCKVTQQTPGSESGEDDCHQEGHVQVHKVPEAEQTLCWFRFPQMWIGSRASNSDTSFSVSMAAASSQQGHSSVVWFRGSFLQAHLRFSLSSPPNSSKETSTSDCIL